MNLTVQDVIKAQIKSRENLDETKNCGTCKYEGNSRFKPPCDKCFNSFMEIVFTPSEYKVVIKETLKRADKIRGRL